MLLLALCTQLEFADVILLNKCDTLAGGPQGPEAQRLAALIATLNPVARVLPCLNSEVPLKEVINTGGSLYLPPSHFLLTPALVPATFGRDSGAKGMFTAIGGA